MSLSFPLDYVWRAQVPLKAVFAQSDDPFTRACRYRNQTRQWLNLADIMECGQLSDHYRALAAHYNAAAEAEEAQSMDRNRLDGESVLLIRT